jgi:hypothetical protein
MEGELIIAGSQSGVQFPDATYTNNVDMPFECHRMIPRVTGLDSTNNVQPVQMSDSVLLQLIRLQIADFGKNVNLLKSPALIDSLVKGTSERTWEWADPYYLVRSEGFQVVANSQAVPVWDGGQIPAAPPANALANFRVTVTFEGFLLQIAPPSNTR